MSISQNFGNTRPSLLLDFANVGRLDPRVTFARASSGTYYDGVTTAKAEENLLLQSQTFNTTWTQTRATVTANSDTAPDGTVTADSVLQAAGQTTSGTVTQSVTVAAGDVVISVFAKPNGKNFLVIREALTDGTNKSTWFNVSTGAIGSTNAAHTATITASTNSYYRCSIKITANAARTASIDLFVADTDGSLTVADDGNGLYLWGAQLEQRSAVTAYTATTTQPITNYIPVLQTAAAGVARFDHDPTTGAALGLEIEEQRTNLATYSEDFANAAWTKTRASISSNSNISPAGTLTADTFIEDTTASNTHVLSAVYTYTAAAHTFSLYAKPAGRDFIRMIIFDGTNSFAAYFDISTGTVGTTTGSVTTSITSVGNGWYRCTITATTLAASGNAAIRLASANATDIYTGDGYSGVYIWGAQLEAGAFPTSYIATTTTALTRSADAASMTGTNFSSWYSAGEGTLLAQYAINGISSVNKIAIIDGGSGFANSLDIYSSSGIPRFDVYVSSALQAQLQPSGSAIASGVSAKVVATFKVNDFAAVRDGGAAVTDTSGTVPSVSRLVIGSANLTSQYLNGHIRRIAYYPVRLSNAQLQALTG